MAQRSRKSFLWKRTGKGKAVGFRSSALFFWLRPLCLDFLVPAQLKKVTTGHGVVMECDFCCYSLLSLPLFYTACCSRFIPKDLFWIDGMRILSLLWIQHTWFNGNKWRQTASWSSHLLWTLGSRCEVQTHSPFGEWASSWMVLSLILSLFLLYRSLYWIKINKKDDLFWCISVWNLCLVFS